MPAARHDSHTNFLPAPSTTFRMWPTQVFLPHTSHATMQLSQWCRPQTWHRALCSRHASWPQVVHLAMHLVHTRRLQTEQVETGHFRHRTLWQAGHS